MATADEALCNIVCDGVGSIFVIDQTDDIYQEHFADRFQIIYSLALLG